MQLNASDERHLGGGSPVELRKWLGHSSGQLPLPEPPVRLLDERPAIGARELPPAPRELLLTSVGHDEVHETVASVLWPILTSTPVYLISDGDHSMPEVVPLQVTASDFLRRRLYSLVPETRTPFYDFSGPAVPESASL